MTEDIVKYEATLTYKQVWDTLSKIDVSKHTQKKMNLTYLSWSWAWGQMMEHFPNACYEFREFEGLDFLSYPDGTASVHCTISIGELERSMWLPVMDNRNQAVENPNARQVSDTKMRCLVKCLAMFGLGWHIYAGEDIPPEEFSIENGQLAIQNEAPKPPRPPNQEAQEAAERKHQREAFAKAREFGYDTKDDLDEFAMWSRARFGVESRSELSEAQWETIGKELPTFNAFLTTLRHDAFEPFLDALRDWICAEWFFVKGPDGEKIITPKETIYSLNAEEMVMVIKHLKGALDSPERMEALEAKLAEWTNKSGYTEIPF